MSLQLVLVCGGRGTRFPGRPAGLPKSMLPVRGEPLAGRLLGQLLPYHGSRGPVIAIVAAGDPHAPTFFAGRAQLVTQERPDGVASAIALALPFLEDDALVALGDIVFAGRLVEPWPSPPALFVWPAAPPRATQANFGVRPDGGAVVEKPADPAGLLCGLGLYLLTREVIAGFAACPPDARGERAITDALAHTIAGGTRFGLVPLDGRYVNVNTPADLAEAEEIAA